MSTHKRHYYGCAQKTQAPHFLSPTDNPQWYLNYVQGYGDKKLPTPALKLLELLSDGRWHSKVGYRASIKTIEACVELELVERRFIRIKTSERSYFGEFRITDAGNQAYGKQCLP